MDEGKEIIPAEQVYLGTITVPPEQVVATATRVATALKKVIDDRKLFSVIQGGKHVHVDGWTTLGAMLGVLPREVSAERQEDGGYVATVELVRVSDGMVIGRASSLCGMDEVDRSGKASWGSKPEYARRSMAVTRATGKAYRLGFAWIMELAGYKTTPAEEMSFVEAQFRDETPKPAVTEESAAAQPGWLEVLTAKDEAWLIEKKIIPPGQKRQHVASLLDLLFKPGEDFKNERGLLKLKAYRGARDSGLKSFEAAANANAALKDQP
ncbi:MAG TPA: hypothetical protein VJK02_21185 [Anaerolineales bacterium]|nr:hypothetical protein [Anaerolineales bacterium]